MSRALLSEACEWASHGGACLPVLNCDYGVCALEECVLGRVGAD